MQDRSPHRSRTLVTWALLIIALNLRPAMAVIGPLIDQIERSTGLDHAGASLLTTLPVWMMGFGALLSGKLRRADRYRTWIAIAVALVMVACAARLITASGIGLLATALLAGAGIAIVQTIVPGFIRAGWGVSAGRMMGLYTTAIMGGAAIAAALAGPLADHLGWSGALAIWALPAIVALSLWLASAEKPRQPTAPEAPSMRTRAPVWRQLRAWELMLFFGIGTAAYTLVLAWLPAFYTGLGWRPSQAGYLLSGVTLAEVIAGLTVSFWAARLRDRRQPLLLALAMAVGGLLCLIFAPVALVFPAIVLLGLGIGALFPLSLIVTLDHVDDSEHAVDLMSFVQGGGYLLAGLAPLGAGALRDRLANLTDAWALMTGGVVVLALMCLRFAPGPVLRAR